MLLEGQDAGLLQQFVAHEELLGGTRDVSVAVLDSHTCEPRLLYLEGWALSQVNIDSSLLSQVNTRINGSSPDVKSLVSNLINHLY